MERMPDVVPSCGVESTACVWGDASCIIPSESVCSMETKTILEDQFDSMKAWVTIFREWMETTTDGDTCSTTETGWHWIIRRWR